MSYSTNRREARKYETVIPLTAGINTITHNLSLPLPFKVSATFHDDGSNQAFIPRFLNYTANSFQVEIAAAISNARIVVIG